ncbi:MAG: hypothetical protein VX340_12275 [Pseudomonadota bacterium]|nr:hypothetical protein [Pseudomonadota bacterium]
MLGPPYGRPRYVQILEEAQETINFETNSGTAGEMEHDRPCVVRNRQEGDKAIRSALVNLPVFYLIYLIKAQTGMDPFAWRHSFAVFPAKTVYCYAERRLFLEIDHVENRHDGVLQ